MLKKISHISLLLLSLVIIIPVLSRDWYLTRSLLLVLLVGSGLLISKEDGYKSPIYLHSLFYLVPFIFSVWAPNAWMDRVGWLTILFVIMGDVFYIFYLRFWYKNNEHPTRP